MWAQGFWCNHLEKFHGLEHKMGVGFLRPNCGRVQSCLEAQQLRQIFEASCWTARCWCPFGKWPTWDGIGGFIWVQGQPGQLLEFLRRGCPPAGFLAWTVIFLWKKKNDLWGCWSSLAGGVFWDFYIYFFFLNWIISNFSCPPSMAGVTECEKGTGGFSF